MIAVTGATGHLGRLVIQALLTRQVPASRIVAIARDPSAATDLEARGVQVREGDYDRYPSLTSALADVDELLLVSSNEVGKRVPQHTNVIDAARERGIRRIVYTSVLHADSTLMRLATEHHATEAVLRGSTVAWTSLRLGWSIENYTDRLPEILATGSLVCCASGGRISAATRADYAAAAAAVLTQRGHENTTYELGGDVAFTVRELAAKITKYSGSSVIHQALSFDAYVEMLVRLGLSKSTARLYADADLAVARGELYVDTGDLRRLIGRPTTRLDDVLVDTFARSRDSGVPRSPRSGVPLRQSPR